MRHAEEYDRIEVGFSTLYLNRCNRSGVLSGGLIGGLDQSGPWKMDARFSRKEIARRIEAIATMASSITTHNMDAEEFMHNLAPKLPETTLVYCDPPYFGKRCRLYLDRYAAGDHARVAKAIQEGLCRKWIVSYDACPEILQYYANRRSFAYKLQYSAERSYRGTEVFILSDEIELPRRSSLSFMDAAIHDSGLTAHCDG
jgi:DNA adenine methylase